MTMHGKDELQSEVDRIKRQYGDWNYDIPLPFGVWTKGNLQIPHSRLKRIVQVVNDLCGKELSETRILDLGCLDGLFSIEFAKQGACTVGVEIREASVQRANFCKESLGLNNLEFRQDDVRNVSLASYGSFDAIVCSGILYHLEAVDALNLIKSMYDMVRRVVVIDTHVALQPVARVAYDGAEYWGSVYREHRDDATPEEKAKKPWASADNPTSFWFTRPSLVNFLSKTGFSSVYECFHPAHLNYGKPGLECDDRCTFVAVKATPCEIVTSPTVNALREDWPEGSLRYAPLAEKTANHRPLLKRVASRVKRMLSGSG